MTTSPVMTVTDELLAELEELAAGVKGWNMTNAFQEPEEGFLPEDLEWYVGQIDEDDNRYPVLNVNAHQYDSEDSEKLAQYYAACNRDKILSMTQELRRLRAENSELARVVKDVRWRVADTTDQLQAYGHNGDRLYGLDEWSVPIRNLNIAIGMLEKATQ